MCSNMTIFGTVISGVIVFIIGEYIKEIVIKPYSRFRDLRGRIAHDLILYANMISNPSTDIIERDNYQKAANELREVAADLVCLNTTMRCSGKKAIGARKEAIKSLTRLSDALITNNNADSLTQNQADVDAIREALKIKRYGA